VDGVTRAIVTPKMVLSMFVNVEMLKLVVLVHVLAAEIEEYTGEEPRVAAYDADLAVGGTGELDCKGSTRVEKRTIITAIIKPRSTMTSRTTMIRVLRDRFLKY
jgi:hypothetical protein